MQRRTLLIGGAILAASLLDVASATAATPEHAPAAINNRGTRLVKCRFKPGGRKIWEDWCVESERRREECVATMVGEEVRTECCYLSDDGEELFYFEDAPDYAKSDSVFKHSHHAIDAEHELKIAECLIKVGPLKTLFEFHNPAMS
jgi:hypothetical protein